MAVTRIASILLHHVLLNYRITDDNRPTTVADVFTEHHPSHQKEASDAPVYKYIYIYINLPVNVIVRLLHPRSGDSQGQETFIALSADKQTRSYETECSNHHPSLSTRWPKGLSRSMMKW